MGKKSVEPPGSSLLETAPHASLGDQRLQLSHDLLRILLLKRALGMSPMGPAPSTQVSQAPPLAQERHSQGCPALGLGCAWPTG